MLPLMCHISQRTKCLTPYSQVNGPTLFILLNKTICDLMKYYHMTNHNPLQDHFVKKISCPTLLLHDCICSIPNFVVIIASQIMNFNIFKIKFSSSKNHTHTVPYSFFTYVVLNFCYFTLHRLNKFAILLKE